MYFGEYFWLLWMAWCIPGCIFWVFLLFFLGILEIAKLYFLCIFWTFLILHSVANSLNVILKLTIKFRPMGQVEQTSILMVSLIVFGGRIWWASVGFVKIIRRNWWHFFRFSNSTFFSLELCWWLFRVFVRFVRDRCYTFVSYLGAEQ